MKQCTDLLVRKGTDATKEFGLTSPPSADLVLVAKNFGELQSRRHLADYDTTRMYSPPDATTSYELAVALRNAMERLRAVGTTELACLVAAMLLPKPRHDNSRQIRLRRARTRVVGTEVSFALTRIARADDTTTRGNPRYVAGMVAYAIKTPPQHGEWEDFLAVWKAADEIDVFESAWTMDHFYPLSPPMDGPILESWTLLAALARETKRLNFGCMVNGMHYRHPAVTANMAATMNHLSGGRFRLGMGAGWFEPESIAYGIELGTLTERFDRFDEGLEVITSLLANEVTNFRGNYYDLTDARCNPKPRQHVPIVIGGKGPKRTLRSVARFADHWDVVALDDVAAWTALSGVLDGHCADAGRDPSRIRRSIHLMWQPDADPRQLAERAAQFGEAGADLVIFSMRGPYEVRLLEPLANAVRASS